MTTTDTAVGLLERAVAHTRSCLGLVADPLLDRPTPCDAWDLRALLEHMDDSLAAFVEVAALGGLGPPAAPRSPAEPASALVDRLRVRACGLLAAWAEPPASSYVGPTALEARLLAGVGAVEIAVHGWDVATACGADVPIPEALARELLPLVPAVVDDGEDRPARFAPASTPTDPSASAHLLALLGR